MTRERWFRFGPSRSRAELRRRVVGALLLGHTLLSVGCARESVVVSPGPAHSDRSPVCTGLVGRFVGLPAESTESASPAPGMREPTPVAGSWWIRRCSTKTTGSEVSVSLEGPGWYWVDAEAQGIALHQQVGLELSAEVTGTLRAGYSSGLVSVWLSPSREPVVSASASDELELESTGLTGAALSLLAPRLLRAKVARRLSAQATEKVRSQLSRGATVTYDVWQNQSDLALEHLAAGEKPAHPFSDEVPWVVNERVLLPPGAAQVFGPLTEDTPHRLDVVNLHGSGLAYRSLCTDAMPAHFALLRRGVPDRLPEQALVERGTVEATGGSVELPPQACSFYLVVSAAGAQRSVADLRIT